jgi:RNA polymerase sigma factor (sigma-70 family)
MEDMWLILRCKQGCRRSLARIYHKYKTDLLLLAVSLLNDPALAEDVVHDVFARFVEGLQGFRLTGSVKGYLLTCVANRSRNLNRDGRPRLSADTVPPVDSVAEPNGPVNRLLGNEALQHLAEAMEQLPYEQREVVALHIYGDLTFKTIGVQQGISVDTIKSRYRYGLKKLKLILNSEETP